MTIIISFI